MAIFKKLLTVILLATPIASFSDCDIPAALTAIRPGSQWSLSGGNYSGLVWNDPVQVKPTLSEVQTAQQACLDALTPAGILSGQRNGAINELLTDPSAAGKLFRAILLVELDEVNTIRALLVPAATPRTISQFKTAVQAKINSGAAD